MTVKKYKTPMINYQKAPVRRETKKEARARRLHYLPLVKIK